MQFVVATLNGTETAVKVNDSVMNKERASDREKEKERETSVL